MYFDFNTNVLLLYTCTLQNKNMGSAAAVLFLGGEVAPVLKLDRRQGSVTNAKTSVRGGGGIDCKGHTLPYWLPLPPKKK